MADQLNFSQESDAHLRQARAAAAYLRLGKVKKLQDMINYLVEKYELSVWGYSHGVGYSVYLTCANLTGLKDEKLETLLNSFIHAEPTETTSRDEAANYERHYGFRWNDNDFVHNEKTYPMSIDVRVTARFKPESETCRRVVVGYKEPSKDPIPVYALECVDADEQHKAEGEQS